MSPATRTHGVESTLVHRIALEEVGCVDLEAVASKVVGKKLTGIGQKNELGEDPRTGLAHAAIIEFDTKDVREVDNGLVLRVIGLGCGYVGLDAIDFLIRSLD
jgi:hypothetical protein